MRVRFILRNCLLRRIAESVALKISLNFDSLMQDIHRDTLCDSLRDIHGSEFVARNVEIKFNRPFGEAEDGCDFTERLAFRRPIQTFPFAP